MTLDDAIKKLGSMSTMISIRAGSDPTRYTDKPLKRWHVVVSIVPGDSQPCTAADDDLLAALTFVIAQVEERKANVKALADQYPALKELPEAKVDFLYPPTTAANGSGNGSPKIF